MKASVYTLIALFFLLIACKTNPADTAAHKRVAEGVEAAKTNQTNLVQMLNQVDADHNRLLEEITQVAGATPDETMLALVNQDKVILETYKKAADQNMKWINAQEEQLKQHAAGKADDAALLKGFDESALLLPDSSLWAKHTSLKAELSQLIAKRQATTPPPATTPAPVGQ